MEYNKESEEQRVKDLELADVSDDQGSTKLELSIFCHYHNNFKSCQFKEITGRKCHFLPKRSPKCKFGVVCTRRKCMYRHDVPHWPLLPTPPPFPWQLPQSPLFPWQHLLQVWCSLPPPRTQQQFWQD